MSRKPILVLASLLICGMSFAQQHPRAAASAVDPAKEAAALAAQKAAALTPATSTCSYTFTAAATATQKYIQTCITVNGNVVEFQSPLGVEAIRVGAFTEGYGICDATGGNAKYFDLADGGDSGNWLAPVRLSLSLTSVKIARTSSDGIWTLTQTFTLDKKATGVDVTMALKNNTAVNRTIQLIRFVDVDANNTVVNNLDGTLDSAWGYEGPNPSFTGTGLMLTRNGPDPFFHESWPINVSFMSDVCNPAAHWVGGPVLNTDGGLVAWDDLTINHGATKTIKLKYQGF